MSLEADAFTEQPELITLDYLDRPMPPGGKGFEKEQHKPSLLNRYESQIGT